MRGRHRHRHRRPPAFMDFVRARMHRRIFAWFGATILLTAVVLGGVMRFTSGEAGWKRDLDHARTFVGHRFSEVWSDPVARDRLAHDTATELDVEVAVLDAHREELDVIGPRCKHPLVVPVDTRGVVEICTAHRAEGWGKRVLVPLFVGLGVLWAMSGMIARRLSLPIGDMARVAEEIGRGKLGTRVEVSRHHHGEVRILADSLNDMAERIEKQLADQRALLATVSHEIRTPLARMRLLAEMARSEPSTSLAKLEAEVDEIDRLVGDLLASSRLDFSAMNRTRLDASKLAQEVVERAEVDPTKLVVEDANVAFEGDATLVARAVANLVENASRHGGGLSCLRVRRADVTNEVIFEAEDDGAGFVAGDEKRIFEPFYKRGGHEQSVGLGLALVKRIAEAHGGRAWAENKTGGGARVGIALPALAVV